ncbi:hypothetical protein [Bdellovibrio sp. KM01]|uniref:hypothetical protein n=1 Tax=Bdellovibrio sp. KM01 TaxID=2748865 RepID=UPI0015EB0BE6|nr:hypothetical protein [Bdellovibrio sp. KM01]QLY26875.1 hypothetical protein HW988_07730 [Bdellovibrio sp. KM01]
MNLDDLKDKLSTELRATWDRIQESGTYNQLRDRYENMTPAMQQLTMYGGIAVVTLMVLSVPYGYFNGSSEAVGEFEGKRMTIRELLKVSREAAEVPAIPPAPSMDMLRANIDSTIKSANLLPEQIKGTQTTMGSNLIPSNLSEGGLQIQLAKLNLRQVVDLGYKFSNISSSVKMSDMMMTANREDNRYFDVVYKLVALAVPAPPVIQAEPETPKKGFNRNKKSRAESEE